MFLSLASWPVCSEDPGTRRRLWFPWPFSGRLCTGGCDRYLLGFGWGWAMLGFGGLGEGSRDCSSPCLCWHCCLLLARAVQGHGLCPCASTSHFLPRSSLAATDTSLTLRPESRHRVAGRQQMSSVLMCSFQYK